MGINPQNMMNRRKAMDDYYGGMDEQMNQAKYLRGRQRSAWGF
jgi:hypothetical protein